MVVVGDPVLFSFHIPRDSASRSRNWILLSQPPSALLHRRWIASRCQELLPPVGVILVWV